MKKIKNASKNIGKGINLQKTIQKDMEKEVKSAKKTPNLQPLGDRVLIRELTEEEKETRTKSRIIIPASSNEDKASKKGKVLAVGPGRYEDGKLLPLSVKVGDTVVFQWGDKIQLDQENANDSGNSESMDVETVHYIVRESEILAIVN